MDVTEKWGDDVESAVELALSDLKLTRDEVDVEVLEQPIRGFFGIGSKLALVRVSRKKTAEPEVPDASEAAAEGEDQAAKAEPAEDQPMKQAPGLDEIDFPETLEEAEAQENLMPRERRDRRDRRDSRERKPRKKNNRNRNQDREPKERNPRLEELDFHKTMDHLPVCEDHPAAQFLKEVTDQMGLKLDMTVRADEKNVYVDIEGEDSGTIIGKRGATLDAIQYLTSLVVNKEHEGYVKVVVDAENYRSKRERTLEQLARKLAGKVARTRRPVRLEPMNPYERKVIHATLQDDDRVTTRSEGQDPYRRVIIELK